MIGDEVLPVRSVLELEHPIREGIIEDPNDVELLWNYCLTTKVHYLLLKNK